MLRILVELAILAASLDRLGALHEIAEKTPWRWSDEKATLRYCIDHYLRDYQAEIVRVEKWLDHPFIIQIKEGKKAVHSWKGHEETVLVNRGKRLFVADFNPIGSGCLVVAVDLADGRQLWKTQLRGNGPVRHSKYRNQVNIEANDDLVIVRGKESSGRYIEFLDIKTGKTVGHRVYNRGD